MYFLLFVSFLSQWDLVDTRILLSFLGDFPVINSCGEININEILTSICVLIMPDWISYVD